MSLRLTSDFYVAQFIRKINGANGFAYLVRRGAIEAGTIFIMQRLNANQVNLFGPAPQSFYDDNIGNNIGDGGRLFIKILSDVEESEAVTKLEKELRFDPDIWLIEIENIDDLNDFLTIV